MRSTRLLAACVTALTLSGCGGSGPDAAPEATGWLAFLGDYETPGQLKAFAVRAEEGTPIDIMGPTIAQGDISALGCAWSSDGTRLAFLADREVDGRMELYVADPAAGSVDKVSGALPPGGNVLDLAWAPDSTRLAFVADGVTDEVMELYVVAATGGPRATVSGLLVAGGDAQMQMRWSPDSSRIAFLADATVNDQFEGYIYDFASDTRVEFSGAMIVGGDVSPSFAWAPDSSQIAFRVDGEVDDRYELYVTPATGGPPSKRNGALVAGGDVWGMQWSPDSTWLAYQASEDTLQIEGYLVPAAGGASERVTPVLPAGVQATWPLVAWAPDSAHVAFFCDQDGNGGAELWIVTAATGIATRVAGSLASTAGVGLSSWSPDGTWIAYVYDEDDDARQEIHVCRALGADHEVLSAESLPNQMLQQPRWAPDGLSLAYSACEVVLGHREVFVARPMGAGGPVQVSDASAENRTIESDVWGWLSNGSGIVWIESDVGVGGQNLFVWNAATGAFTPLAPPPVVGGHVYTLRLP